MLRCLSAPRVALVRADERTEVQRVLSFDGPYVDGFNLDSIYIDVLCVKDVVVLVEHRDAQCHLRGCSPRCLNGGVVIRYEENGVSKSKMLHTVHRNLKSDLVPELVARIKWEIEHGATTVIDPENMVHALVQSQPAARSRATP